MLIPAPAMFARSFTSVEFVYRSAVNPHAHLHLRLALECAADFDCATDRRFRAVEENQRHAVARWNADEFPFGFGRLNLRGVRDDKIQLLLNFTLFIEQKLGIPDNVHEQDMPDLHLRFWSVFRSHIAASQHLVGISIFLQAFFQPSGSALRILPTFSTCPAPAQRRACWRRAKLPGLGQDGAECRFAASVFGKTVLTVLS